MLKLSKKKLLPFAALALCALLVAGLVLRLTKKQEPFTSSAFAMGSYVQQTLYGAGSEQAAREAVQEITRLENQISWRREHSAIYNLNHAEGAGPVPLDENSREILEMSLEVSEKSGGAFDPTIAPVSQLWDFDSDPHLPSKTDLDAARALVDYKKLTLADAGASLPAGMAVDLGAAGKGAACDTAVEIYRQAGVKGAVVAVGGSVGLYGEKPDGSPWQVSVRDPWGSGSIGVLALGEGFVSTSGSYEKTFEQDGCVYHHLLDPKTGYPAQSGLVSVTVYSSNGSLSDCLATACFILGQEESLPLLEDFSAEAVFIEENGNISCTPGLAEAFTPVL